MTAIDLYQRLMIDGESLVKDNAPEALLRAFMVPVLAALDAVPELDDRPRTALGVTARWLDGAIDNKELIRAWRDVPVIDRNRGEDSWRQAATAAFFYGNAATRFATQQVPFYYEWSGVARRLINVWMLLGEPEDAAHHRVMTLVRGALPTAR